MELFQIRYALALADTLNFHRAAESLFITQPTLSQQIQHLEEELGVQLFERNKRSVRVTPAGTRFLEYARTIVDLSQQAVEELRRQSQHPVGLLRVGAIPTILPFVIPAILRCLKQLAPDLQLRLYDETTSVLIQRLKDGGIDLALLSLPIEDPLLHTIELGREEFVAVVSDTHPLAARQSITTADLRNEEMMILKEGHCFRDQAIEFCRRREIEIRYSFEGSDLFSLFALVSAGMGTTLAPEMAIDRIQAPNTVWLRFQKDAPVRRMGVAVRTSMKLDPRHEAFIHAARHAIQERLAPKNRRL